MRNPSWLKDAVIYNIYPQSFQDTNGDGIGDLKGITKRLDFIADMGYTAIWLNPIYVSPFRDGGYDVADFYKVAPRYGTNDDFRELASEAKKRNIRVILDLVAGHTALECEWFQKSKEAKRNEYSDRYIWTNSIWDSNGGKMISGYSDRDGCYLQNFFYCQPALNYGYKNITKPWQLPMNHPSCMENRRELLKIMDFWINLGADGFRVDMASSLVKDDPDKEGIKELWNDIISKYKKKHPECVLISEWGIPKAAINCGFDIDLLVHFNLKAYTTLFRYEKGANQSDPWVGHSYFRKEGKGDINEFLEEYLEQYNDTKQKGFIAISSGNHDLKRVSVGRDTEDLKVVYAFLLTMPGVPFIYYGDEIGMRYIDGLDSKEGGFNRTGSRTPMQWNNSKNLGFSENSETYLPIDSSVNAPTVEDQIKDENSLLNFVKSMIKLRKAHPALCSSGDFEVMKADYPFVYKRKCEDEELLVMINPSDREYNVETESCSELCSMNCNKIGNSVSMGKVSFFIGKTK